jgi:8-oxo-dGTP diphosphatase
MKTFFLLVIAILLSIFLVPLGFVFGCISAIGKHELNSYLMSCAITIDKGGNVSCKYLLSLIMIKPHAYQFGNTKETISSVLGKNSKKDNLTLFGKMVNLLLDKIQKDHTLISIDDNI